MNRKGMHICNSCKHLEDFGEVCGSCDVKNCYPPSKYEPYSPEKHFEEKEAVNHPDHYNAGKFECIEVMAEVFGIEATQTFCILNAFKYLWRCDHKENRVKDVEKAHWYLKKFIELEMLKNGKS